MIRHGEPRSTTDGADQDKSEQLRVLSDEECVDLLKGHHFGRLAFAVDGRATIFPVNYLYDEASVVVRTAPGLKLDEAPLRGAAFEIDDASPDGSWGWSVVVQGPCYDVTSARDHLSERLRQLPLLPWAPGARAHWLRIAADQITGRAFGSAHGLTG